MSIKKLVGKNPIIQLPLKSFVKRSRDIISSFEEPFYRTNNPMGYAILAGILLGCFIFIVLGGLN